MQEEIIRSHGCVYKILTLIGQLKLSDHNEFTKQMIPIIIIILLVRLVRCRMIQADNHTTFPTKESYGAANAST